MQRFLRGYQNEALRSQLPAANEALRFIQPSGAKRFPPATKKRFPEEALRLGLVLKADCAAAAREALSPSKEASVR